FNDVKFAACRACREHLTELGNGAKFIASALYKERRGLEIKEHLVAALFLLTLAKKRVAEANDGFDGLHQSYVTSNSTAHTFSDQNRPCAIFLAPFFQRVSVASDERAQGIWTFATLSNVQVIKCNHWCDRLK